MSIEKRDFVCHFCEKKIECSAEKPPCEALKGWSTISSWNGAGAVSHHSFCSLDCLKSWVDAQITKIPQVFMEAFDEVDN